jgi:tRNA G18 (ribose-2'-O)-methylase SpoU
MYRPKYDVNTGTLVRSARAMGADYVFFIDGSYKEQESAVGHDEHIPIFEFDDLNEALRIVDPEKLVGVELDDRSIDLRNYSHPDSAMYLLGRESTGIPDDVRKRCDDLVEIPADYCLNVSTSGSLVLYDRLIPSDDMFTAPTMEQVEEVLER